MSPAACFQSSAVSVSSLVELELGRDDCIIESQIYDVGWAASSARLS
ncbi:hypothetical protein IMZ48_34490 [Candidatus Bathyarchaeota archaeon]|nr:hypothetical protein [Candidatus Bathyarchaeota archaeon]